MTTNEHNILTDAEIKLLQDCGDLLGKLSDKEKKLAAETLGSCWEEEKKKVDNLWLKLDQELQKRLPIAVRSYWKIDVSKSPDQVKDAVIAIINKYFDKAKNRTLLANYKAERASVDAFLCNKEAMKFYCPKFPASLDAPIDDNNGECGTLGDAQPSRTPSPEDVPTKNDLISNILFSISKRIILTIGTQEDLQICHMGLQLFNKLHETVEYFSSCDTLSHAVDKTREIALKMVSPKIEVDIINAHTSADRRHLEQLKIPAWSDIPELIERVLMMYGNNHQERSGKDRRNIADNVIEYIFMPLDIKQTIVLIGHLATFGDTENWVSRKLRGPYKKISRKAIEQWSLTRNE